MSRLKTCSQNKGCISFDDGLEPLLQAAESRGNTAFSEFIWITQNYDTGMPDWLLRPPGALRTPSMEELQSNYESPLLQNNSSTSSLLLVPVMMAIHGLVFCSWD